MNRNAYTRLVLFVLLSIKISNVFGQISKGGTPLSISGKISTSIPVQDIPQPDWAKIREEDKGIFANFRFAVPIVVDFNMEKTDQGWKVYNIKIEGISLVDNYRNTFNTEIQKNGVDGLIKALADKNQSNAQVTQK